ncbi:MAG: hypothetical protein E3J86_00150 [Candidatus Thorarchaeota archaeon]|nr:MAG: hypothetical protein E3J86_00150 [Candidatus Thorarchaeota archaeon]
MLEPGFETTSEVTILSTAVEPVFSLNRVIAGRSARLLAALGGTSVLLYLGVLIPGLFFLFLPLTIASLGKVYDETRIIKFLKYGEPLKPGNWEEVETSTERIRIKASGVGFDRGAMDLTR